MNCGTPGILSSEDSTHDFEKLMEVGFNPYCKRLDCFYDSQCRENELKIWRELKGDALYQTYRCATNELPFVLLRLRENEPLGGLGQGNLVLGDNLLEHIAYNQCFRFGQALFVRGALVHLGYMHHGRFTDLLEITKNWESLAIQSSIPTHHQVPYL